MIIKLKGATFSNNINGLLNSWPITFYGRTLVTGTFDSSVSKGETYTATFSVADQCTVDSVAVTRGGDTVSGATISDGTITISVPTTTESGPISITFNGSKENGDDPVIPEDPVVPDTPEWAIYDNFDRADTNDGIGSTDTGETWEAIVSVTDAGKSLLKIYDGKVKGNTAGKYPSAVVAATESDRYVEIEIAVNTCGGQVLLYDKYEDATNYIAARRGKDGIITLLKKVDGVNTEVAKTTETYTDNNLVLAIQCIGNDHTIFANGTQILTGTVSEFASAARVGFSINETSDMCDNFKVKYL